MNVITLLIEIISNSIGYLFFLPLIRSRYPKKITLSIVLCFIWLSLLLSLYPYMLFYQNTYNFPIRLLHIALGMILGIAISSFTLSQTLFSYLTACTFVVLKDISCDTIDAYFSNSWFGIFMKLLTFVCLSYILLNYIRKTLLNAIVTYKHEWLKLCAMPASLILTFLFLASYPLPLHERPENMLAAICLGFTILIFNADVQYLLQAAQQNFQTSADLNAMELHMSTLKKHIQYVSESEEKLRIFQHDQRHYTNTIIACIQHNNYKEALHILSNMNGTLKSISRPATYYCNNTMINSVLSAYMLTAENAHIKATIKLLLQKNVTSLQENLVVALANAFENAICACEKIPDETKRKIEILGKEVGNQFFLEVSNTYEETVTFDKNTRLPYSPLESHGFGSRSIAAFAEKHEAILDYQVDDTWFRLRLNFQLKD